MPATRPPDAEPTGDTDALIEKGDPFTIHYDKLIIAVGAYSQSELSTSSIDILVLMIDPNLK